jgi:photosystem II stability/assembly factor-like uncharacterized protein
MRILIRRSFRPLATGALALAAALAVAALPAAAATNLWTPLGDDTGHFSNFAPDPFEPGILYAVSADDAPERTQEVFRSTDGGQSWSWAHAGLSASPVTLLEADPVRPRTLYAANQEGHFYRSTDRGTSWTELSVLAPSGVAPSRLAMVPRGTGQPAALFLYGPSNIQRSLDGGLSWQQTLTSNQGVTAVAADPVRPRRLFASTNGRILRSDDLGATWTLLPRLPLLPGTDVAVHVAGVTPAAVIAYSRGAIHRSTDGGQTWRRILLPQAGSLGTAFADDGTRLWAGFTAPAVVMSSSDGGLRWRVERQTSNPRIHRLWVQPTRRDVYFLGAATGVDRRPPAGEWVRLATRGLLNESTATYTRGSDPRVIYRGTEKSVSVDGGLTFAATAPVPPPGADADGFHVEVDADHPALRFTATAGGAVYASLDGGVNWSRRGTLAPPAGLPSIQPKALRLTFFSGQTLLGRYPCGLSRSTDGGATWSEILPCIEEAGTTPSENIRQEIRELIVSPLEPRTIFAQKAQTSLFGTSHGLLRSTDGGATFTQVLSGPSLLRIAPSDAHQVYQARNGLWRSTNGGQTFVQVAPYVLGLELQDFQIDPHDPLTVYVALKDQGVRVSHDGGTTWNDISAGLAAYFRLNVLALAVHPTDGTLYAYPSRGGTFSAKFD